MAQRGRGYCIKYKKSFKSASIERSKKSRARQTIYVCIFPYLFLNTPIVLVNCRVQERERKVLSCMRQARLFCPIRAGHDPGVRKKKGKKEVSVGASSAGLCVPFGDIGFLSITKRGRKRHVCSAKRSAANFYLALVVVVVNSTEYADCLVSVTMPEPLSLILC